jgi:hypothetical protein
VDRHERALVDLQRAGDLSIELPGANELRHLRGECPIWALSTAEEFASRPGGGQAGPHPFAEQIAQTGPGWPVLLTFYLLKCDCHGKALGGSRPASFLF